MVFRSKRLPGNQVREFYRIIIREIVGIGPPTTDRALQALAWIWHAKEPLTELALQEATGASGTELILGPCMGLVSLSTTGYFQFSHTTTVTEFLAEPKNFEDLGATLFSPLELAKKCLDYLDSPEFESMEVGRHGFGDYAANYWGDHVREVECSLLQGIEDLSHFRFLASVTKRDLMLKLNDRSTSTILHFAAEKGLTKFCRLCLDAKGRSVASRDCH